jgi:outer membrane protein TolC
LPPLQKALAQQRNLLATLSGRLPSETLIEHFSLGEIPLPHELPLSLPSKLVEQRPDVRAAEANVHAASALVGVAAANQLPQITLNAGVSSAALTLGSLFGPGLIASTIGMNVLQTVIDGGTLAAKKRAAYAALDQADAQYRSTVLTAFRNVADTLRALEYDAIALKATVTAENASATSLDIARRRLDLGDTTYVFVRNFCTSRRCWPACRRRPTATWTRPRSSRRWAAAGGIATSKSPRPSASGAVPRRLQSRPHRRDSANAEIV